MVNEKLVSYLREQNLKGYSFEELYNILIKKGWNSDELKSAIEHIKTQEISNYPKNFSDLSEIGKENLRKIIEIIGILVIILIILSIIIYFLFIKVSCNENQYKIGRECFDYACLKDSNCDDNNKDTLDLCVNASTKYASCVNNVMAIAKENPPPDAATTNKTNQAIANMSLDVCISTADCNDFDYCTKDSCSGTPKNCAHLKITNCTSGDSCCPSGCKKDKDNDCQN